MTLQIPNENSQTNTDTQSTNPTENRIKEAEKVKVDFLLKEYEVLRQEILDKFKGRSNLISSGVAALTVFITIPNILQENDNVSRISDTITSFDLFFFLILVLLIPLACSLIISFWTAYSSTIATIGLYLTHIEQRIENLSPDTSSFHPKKELIHWENFLRRNNSKRLQELITSVGFVAIFSLIAICSLIFGCTTFLPKINQDKINLVVFNGFTFIGLSCIIYGLHSSIFNIKLIFKGFSKVRNPL
ncbi:hypothetical protein [Nostoc sp. GT001]|uniref:hypothetical protein n=1 Tax=Nostoc sp. GT001 TaxID=3056647 RepID=UPI0025AA42AF|nr:hypothetical protein [Nostoc sp. GT001]MDM9582419.1 hypothetical protein [Nostoc sp. GT001]